ncbi:hypothetical protein ACIBU0_31255 [Streptomyces sp. NPDC049627]|uniref:hypothetical protein n=1 Tax=Streptomyces sp. NPDC049627 TaxID=3365595 RepID=UPI00379E9F66
MPESAVRVKVPLAEPAGRRPAGCDRLSYPRYRAAHGPDADSGGDRILVAQTIRERMEQTRTGPGRLSVEERAELFRLLTFVFPRRHVPRAGLPECRGRIRHGHASPGRLDHIGVTPRAR